MKHKFIIVGGGAAGVFASIRAAELNPDLEVILLEGQSKLLGKVRISGGGRCNVTHNCFDPRRLVQFYPRGHKELVSAFHRFHVENTIQWFSERGVQLKTEEDGRMFPASDSSETIISCFVNEMRRLGVKVRLNQAVLGIRRLDHQFYVQTKSEEITADKILLATGSSRQGYRLAESLGHSLVSPVPSLFSFEIKQSRLRGLEGVSFSKLRTTLKVGHSTYEQTDPALITHWGMSGPAIIRLSAWAARDLYDSKYQAQLILDFLPDVARDQVFNQLWSMRETYPHRLTRNSSVFKLPQRFYERLLGELGIADKKWVEVSKRDVTRLAEDLKSLSLEVSGKGVFKEEFVTAGGVNRKEVDFRTMESRLCPGLFFAGELMDVDGITGGFNFQFAWTSGYLAGSTASSEFAA